jgi:hypothetical protein
MGVPELGAIAISNDDISARDEEQDSDKQRETASLAMASQVD